MKGLSFNAEMALAVLEGRKTAHRVVMKPQPNMDHHWTALPGYTFGNKMMECVDGLFCKFWHHIPGRLIDGVQWIKSPYRPGEEVYMQEPWGIEPGRYMQPSIPHGYGGRFEDELFYKADDPNLPGIKWRSSVTLPCKLSRLHLRLTVRPEKEDGGGSGGTLGRRYGGDERT